jgi:tetratricopeptide (TPR) repeat protein
VRDVLVTRLELALRKYPAVRTGALAEEAAYARQHLLRLRAGEGEPSRRAVIAITDAFARLTGAAISAEQLFERADELLRSNRRRLSDVHAADVGTMSAMLNERLSDDWTARVLATGVASETVVRLLLTAARERLDSHPSESALIYATARDLTLALATTPPELRAALEAHAAAGEANALRLLGKLEDALSLLATAGSLFAAATYCDVEAGDVEIGRASTLFTMERWNEAINAARAARRRFKAGRNARRMAHCRLLEAAAMAEQGNHDGARNIWLEVLGTLTSLRDHEGVGRVCLNLGACETLRGRPHQARHWLNRASAIFRSTGNNAELARTRWNMATYFARFRSSRLGLRAMERARRAFIGLRMWVDAACVGLEMTELMISSGATEDVLTRHAREVASVLVSAGLGASAAESLDQLRRIAASAEKHAVIRDVREALRHAGSNCDPVRRQVQEAGSDDQRPPDIKPQP